MTFTANVDYDVEAFLGNSKRSAITADEVLQQRKSGENYENLILDNYCFSSFELEIFNFLIIL